MSIEEIRAIQKNRQINAIDQRRSAESITRIGDRDPLTGKFQVLNSDGGVSPQGVKVYNAQEQYGDRVLPFPRTDGTIALDSEKGSFIKQPTAFPHCPGYLNGQVFNCEVPKKKKKGKIWILYLLDKNLYLGGHEQEPVLIENQVKTAANDQTIDFNSTVWGDRDGWVVCYPTQIGRKVATESGVKFYPPLGGFNEGLEKTFLGNGLMNQRSSFIDVYDYEKIKISGSGSSYPEPFQGKVISRDTSKAVDSYKILFRDRDSAFAYRLNTQYDPGENFLYTSISTVTDFMFISTVEGQRDRVLFTEENLDLRWPKEKANGDYYFKEQIYREDLFNHGAQPWGYSPYTNITYNLFKRREWKYYYGNSYAAEYKAAYKYNYPYVSVIESWGSFRHLNTLQDHSVRIHDVNKKTAVVDGAFEIVDVEAWGIPQNAYIIDACAWVP